MDLLALAAIPALAYLTVTVLVAFDAMVPAVPSEVALVTAGTLAAAGHLQIGWAIAAATAGALAGDYTMHSVGRRALPGALARSRLGRSIHRGVDRAYAGMGSASTVALIAGRFVPFGRTASAAAAGLAGIPRARFVVCSVIGGALWAGWMIGLGFSAGTFLDGVPMWLQSVLGAGVAIVVGVWVAAIQTVIRTRRRMSARATQAAPLTGTTPTANSTGSPTAHIAGTPTDSTPPTSAPIGEFTPDGEIAPSGEFTPAGAPTALTARTPTSGTPDAPADLLPVIVRGSVA